MVASDMLGSLSFENNRSYEVENGLTVDDKMRNDEADRPDIPESQSEEIAKCNSAETGISPTASGVRFEGITIREYFITIGDNPSPLFGPPLSLDWMFDSEYSLTVDRYEELRQKRRTGREMMIPSRMREDILLQSGFARKEIVAYTKPVNIARSQRRRTAASLGLSTIEEVSETIHRKIVNMVTFGKQKKEERKFLAPYKKKISIDKMEESTASSSSSSSLDSL